ncbi:multidrug transporter AcrB [Sphingorhabdus lutea]|uniref:Multidrug transporter AcrB n=1 Tax=Sphingorhabdus lutea TaxID=1913578 RepID=A0A1L3JDN5_9SPHN|nr:efflux RND transporter permease subunit [Sphingorhabdus lutea]APG63230.1 multidrug transporter AcrB [Sphingorhabdus lutea]
MHLAEFAIKRWQLTAVLFLLLSALGINAFMSIPRAVDPHFPIPVTNIVAIQPGADASEMEETVAKPIEEVLQGLDDVKRISSTSRDGSAVITIEFDWAGDPDEYYNDVIREIGAIRSQLPSGLQRLDFRRTRTTEAAVVQLAMISETASWRRLDKYSDDLSDILNRNKSVRQVKKFGIPQPEISVLIDNDKLAELRLPATMVADILAQGGVDLPGGAVQSGARRFNVDAGGAYRDLDRIKNLPIRTNEGTLLTLGDVAQVSWGQEENLHITRHNGKRALLMSVTQKPGTDATKVKDLVVQQMHDFADHLPPDIKMELQFDQSKDISFRLRELARDFIIALSLVLITLLPLGFRSSLIVMISIPLSLASGLLGINMVGYNFNQLVVLGFILSLGLLVDDSIVVTENIARHLRMGKDRVVAAIDATKEITPAILGSTGVLLFAFFPLLFLPEGAGKYTRGSFVAVIFTVSASLVISLTVIPFLASRVLKRDEDPEGNRIFQILNGGINKFYRPILHRALDNPRKTFYGSMLLTFSAFLLVPIMGFSLFPDADTSYFRIEVEAEKGSSIANTDRIIKQVAEIVRAEPDVKIVAENVGAGNPQIFYNVFSNMQATNYGDILVIMDEWKGRESREMVARLRSKLDDISGAQIKVKMFQNGAPIEAPIVMFVQGQDLGILKKLASQVEAIMRRTPGLRDVENPVATDRIDLDANIDVQKAALLNIADGAPRRAIRLALNGEQASRFRDNEGDVYPVTVRLAYDKELPISALKKIYVSSRDGQPIMLDQISNPRLSSVPPEIKRHQLERNVSVTAQLRPGAVITLANNAVLEEVSKLKLPPGYKIVVGGEASKIDETLSGFGPAVMIALFGIFAILVAEFGRFRETIVVAGVIPLGLFGGIILLFLTGNPISFMAVIGFIALIGIEIKNSILLVDFTTQLREQGMELREAIEKAGEIRFMPVLLTSVTAVGGLLPLALLGGALFSPLATVIIGGLITSTILSRVVTPAMYLLVLRAGQKRDSRKMHKTAKLQ